MNAVVLTTARQEQWLRQCQLDMLCVQLQHGAQPIRSFLRTVSNNSLQRWAHNFTKLNIDVSIEWCKADYYSSTEAMTERLSVWHDVQPRGSLVQTMTSNSLQKWAYTLETGTGSTAQKLMSADCIKQQFAEMSSQVNADSRMNAVVLTTAKQKQSDWWIVIFTRAHGLISMYSSETYLCDLWQATACRNELTASPSYVLERNVQASDWFLRTMSRNSLQRWAHSCHIEHWCPQ